MIGETLGQYRIDAHLGTGGMGVVYRAHDERLQRIVALKLIGSEQRGSTADERDRLLAEARAASHLNHPHIAFAADRAYSGGIFIVGADGQGQPQITRDGGWPVWWPDGKRIGYLALGRDGNARIRVTTVEDGTTRTLDTISLQGFNRPFAVFPDGHRIVVGNAIHDLDEIWVLEPKR